MTLFNVDIQDRDKGVNRGKYSKEDGVYVSIFFISVTHFGSTQKMDVAVATRQNIHLRTQSTGYGVVHVDDGLIRLLSVTYVGIGNDTRIRADVFSPLRQETFSYYGKWKDGLNGHRMILGIPRLKEKEAGPLRDKTKINIRATIKKDGKKVPFANRHLMLTFSNSKLTAVVTTDNKGEANYEYGYYNVNCIVGWYDEKNKKIMIPSRPVKLKRYKNFIPYDIGSLSGNTRPTEDHTPGTLKNEPTCFYYAIESETVYCLTKDQASQLEKDSSDLARAIEDIAKKKAQLQTLMGKLPEACGSCVDPRAIGQLSAQIDKANRELIDLEDKLSGKLKALNISAEKQSITELIPLRAKGTSGSKYVYADGQIAKKQNWANVPLTDKEKSGKDNIIKGGRIDKETLEKQLGLKKDELIKKGSIKGINAKWETKHEDALHDWSKHWASGDGMIDVSRGAQFMRLSAGLGASAEFVPEKLMFKLSAKMNVAYALVAGEGTASLYLPHKLGVRLHFGTKPVTGQSAGKELGRVRYLLSLGYEGFAGASAVLQGGMDFNLSKSGIKGTAPLEKNRLVNTENYETKATAVEQWETGVSAKAEMSGFAGVSAGGKFEGACQWFMADEDNMKWKWYNLAKINAGIHAQLGVGYAKAYEIGIKNGRIYGHMKAGLCWGLGAKGNIGFEVDAAHIATLAVWVYRANEKLRGEMRHYVSKELVIFIGKIQLLALDAGKTLLLFAKTINLKDVEKKFEELLEMKKTFIKKVASKYATTQIQNRLPKELAHLMPSAAAFLQDCVNEWTQQNSGSGGGWELPRLPRGGDINIPGSDILKEILNFDKLLRLRVQTQYEANEILAYCQTPTDYSQLIASLPQNMGAFPVPNNSLQARNESLKMEQEYVAYQGNVPGKSTFEESEEIFTA